MSTAKSGEKQIKEMVFFLSLSQWRRRQQREVTVAMATVTTEVMIILHCALVVLTGDPLHSRAACTQPCNVNTHSRAYCSPGARLCEQWGHGCVNNGARLCASARLCRGSPVVLLLNHVITTISIYAYIFFFRNIAQFLQLVQTVNLESLFLSKNTRERSTIKIITISY